MPGPAERGQAHRSALRFGFLRGADHRVSKADRKPFALPRRSPFAWDPGARPKEVVEQGRICRGSGQRSPSEPEEPQ